MVLKKELTEKIVNLHNQGKNNSEITRILKIQHRTVANHLKVSLNYIALSNMSKTKRKYNLNENFFESIETEEQSYWLGFIYADGYVYNSIKPTSGKRDRHLKISLNKQDYDHLEKFKISLKSDSPIKMEKRLIDNYPTVKIFNKKIVNDLIKLGCVQGKTHKLTFPNFLKKELIKHFIRGYFDGDGCITKSNKEKNNKANINITGTKEFLIEIQKNFNEDIGLNFTKMSKRHKDRDDDIFTIHYGGNNVMKKIKNYFYNESTYFLERKYEKFNNWVN